MKECFKALGLNDELMVAVKEMNIRGPTENQIIGIPGVLEGENVVLGANPEVVSGSTMAYLLAIIQLLRRDEVTLGIAKLKHPRAIVLCPLELANRISRLQKIIMHYVRGGDGSFLQDVSFDAPIGLVIGTASSFLQKIEKGEFAYDEIKYLVLEDANTMFDNGYSPDIGKFLGPLLGLESDERVLLRVLVFTSLTKIVSEEDAPFAREKIGQYMQEKLPGFSRDGPN